MNEDGSVDASYEEVYEEDEEEGQQVFTFTFSLVNLYPPPPSLFVENGFLTPYLFSFHVIINRFSSIPLAPPPLPFPFFSLVHYLNFSPLPHLLLLYSLTPPLFPISHQVIQIDLSTPSLSMIDNSIMKKLEDKIHALTMENESLVKDNLSQKEMMKEFRDSENARFAQETELAKQNSKQIAEKAEVEINKLKFENLSCEAMSSMELNRYRERAETAEALVEALKVGLLYSLIHSLMSLF